MTDNEKTLKDALELVKQERYNFANILNKQLDDNLNGLSITECAENFAKAIVSKCDDKTIDELLKMATILEEVAENTGYTQKEILELVSGSDKLSTLKSNQNFEKPEADEIEIVEIPKLTTRKLDKAVMPNNKLTYYLDDPALYDGCGLGLQTLSGDDQNLHTACVITFEDETVFLNENPRITEFDRAVYNAIISHYIAGNKIITSAMIYKAMSGKQKNNAKPSPQQIGAITKSIKKMGFMRLEIDATNEFKSRGISLNGEYIKKGFYEDYLINYSKLTVATCGEEISGYMINTRPILYNYASAVGQILTVPIEVLDVPPPDTEKNIILKNYLIRRIEICSNKFNHNKINFKTIDFEKALYPLVSAGSNQEKKRTRDAVIEMLKYWSEINYISNFDLVKKGKTFSSILLDVKIKKA